MKYSLGISNFLEQISSLSHSIVFLYFFASKNGEVLYSKQKQDQELTVDQIMSYLLQNSDLKKVGKSIRPFRYELNQIPYDYTVEVTNRFKGLDLMD